MICSILLGNTTLIQEANTNRQGSNHTLTGFIISLWRKLVCSCGALFKTIAW
ncbi:unnamed protein product [Tuber melanosporum]|uniref:(Perigord truffle) hypothetical protein n=1 Tax=Tuber melanosporum (strain Mel28) TaxID=656061 RepID=D5GM65_TUBMM|nr:uncharacterized protein GSTUM_00010544001 [Tuber melanosporum]CAZ85608.1 unnamed protein product [Tuber melanosporum]